VVISKTNTSRYVCCGACGDFPRRGPILIRLELLPCLKDDVASAAGATFYLCESKDGPQLQSNLADCSYIGYRLHGTASACSFVGAESCDVCYQ